MLQLACFLAGAGVAMASAQQAWAAGAWCLIFSVTLGIIHYGIKQARTWPK